MFRRSLVLGLTYLLTTAVIAAQSSTNGRSVLPDEPGVHFILLMDESGDMSHTQRQVLVNALPELLFKGSYIGKDVQPSLPRYQLGRDQISAVYFSILKTDNSGCSPGRKGMSARPEDMFSFDGELNIKDENELRNRVGTSWNQPCRFPGYYSPIASASLLVLPYLQEQLKHDRLYSRTILIVATNKLYNTKISPASELTVFNSYQVDTDAASQKAYEVSRLFYFNMSPGWNVEVLKDNAYFMISEVTPLPSADSALNHQRSISLDRHAIGSNKLRVVPEFPRAGELWIWSRGESADYSFLPLSLNMRFRDPDGRAWQVGQKTLPDTISVDLKDCESGRCRKEDDRINVPLFDVVGEDLTISASDPDLNAGRLNFDVGLRYKTKQYDHIFVRSSEQHIDFSPTPPATVSRFFFLLPGITLDNGELANQWTPDADGVTTQQEAANQIRARQKWYQILTILALILLVGYLFLYHYRRKFKPHLEWKPSSAVVVDFNRPPAESRTLVGTLTVINDGELPWLGRFLRNKEQPARTALLSVSYNFFKAAGFVMNEGNPIGFANAKTSESTSQTLYLETEETVSDGREIYLFLAAETFQDYSPKGETPGDDVNNKDFEIGLTVNMKWGMQVFEETNGASFIQRLKARLAGNDGDPITENVTTPLTIKPEEPRKPLVTFEPATGQPLYFNKGERVLAGTFMFGSKSDLSYARHFKSNEYEVTTYKDNRPLGVDAIVLERSQIDVPPRKHDKIPVFLVCDGNTIPNPGDGDAIPNPEASFDVYDFKLSGDGDVDSNLGFHSATLYRDPTVAEVELNLLHPKPELEIFWNNDNQPCQRLLLNDGRSAEEQEITNSTIHLGAQNIEFDVGTGQTYDLLAIRIGNSGKSNRGLVKVDIKTKAFCDDVTRGSIRVAPGQHFEDLISVYRDDDIDVKTIEVKESDRPKTREIRIQPGIIEKIQGAVIEANKLSAHITLDIVVFDDQKRERHHRTLNVVVPLRLEQLPGKNWLCIDFGTSAIAVAIGTGAEGGITYLPLQNISKPGGASLADYDIANAEYGKKYLLPSWVVCDSDIRTDRRIVCYKGFPAYYDKNLSLTPGEPDFVGLPATSAHLEQQPERVIYSLKSWLATTARHIRLGEKIKYQQNGVKVESETLPLKEVVESGLAALAEAYVLPHSKYRADRIVICHPNTFTERHRELLKDIVLKVFAPSDRLGIPLEDRIRLLSESDAVASYYCRRQKRLRRRSGMERILIYDFGAGTLDQSLINVEWKLRSDGSCDPVGWDIEGQLGVPVAGNYIDELLARTIDELLQSPVLEGIFSVKYRFPIVRPEIPVEESGPDFWVRYRRAILRLWERIKEAKHDWDGKSSLNVKVGVTLGGAKGYDHIVAQKSEAHVLANQPLADRASLWSDGSFIYLSIPAERIHKSQRFKKFINFVSETVIDELCNSANASLEKIDTVIISGRGALWPGLQEKIWSRFPNGTATPDLDEERVMKEAVVRGAIERQDMRIEINDKRWKPKLGVLKDHDETLVLEDDWDKPVELFASPTFKLVQVNCKHPRPLEDLKPGNLRRHFYIPLAEEFRRQGEWERANEVFVTKGVTETGKLSIHLTDKVGHQRISVFALPVSAEVKTNLPWPIGPENYVLEPEPEPQPQDHEESTFDEQVLDL